jgi:hypothetical protein
MRLSLAFYELPPIAARMCLRGPFSRRQQLDSSPAACRGGHAAVCAAALFPGSRFVRNGLPARLANSRLTRSAARTTAARHCRIDSAPGGRTQSFGWLVTRALPSPTNDATRLRVVAAGPLGNACPPRCGPCAAWVAFGGGPGWRGQWSSGPEVASLAVAAFPIPQPNSRKAPRKTRPGLRAEVMNGFAIPSGDQAARRR